MSVRSVVLSTAFILLAAPLRAAPVDDLLSALRVADVVEIMREEGLDYGVEIGGDMLPGGSTGLWEETLSRIYDTDKMLTVVRDGFASSLEGQELDTLVAFFEGEAGQRIVALELSAREAMVDEDVEEAARAAYRAAEEDDAARLDQIERFVEANDLIEANVVGALNASYLFYRGLVEGGAFEMTEDDMLREVWSQEEETREDTTEWLYAFLLMAYGPLSDETLDEYVALSATEDGQAMNRALFAGFNRMYDEISLALGLALAQQMQGQDL